jgi:hypothetical protein
MTSKKKLHIHNENKVKVIIHNTHPKSKRKRRSNKTTRTLGTPIQGQMQPIIINHPIPPREESQNELNRLAHNYIQPDLRNTLLLRNEPEPQVEFQNIPEKQQLLLKPKRDYNKTIHSIKSQLGFPDNDNVNYLNKTYKTLKQLRDHIKKENPNIPDEVLKSINSKNRNEKLSYYLKWKQENISGGNVSKPKIINLEGNIIYPMKEPEKVKIKVKKKINS